PGENVVGADGVGALLQDRQVLELVDHVQPARLRGAALARRGIGQEAQQVAWAHKRLARAGSAQEIVDRDSVEIARRRAELRHARQDVVESQAAGKSVQVDGREVHGGRESGHELRLEYDADRARYRSGGLQVRVVAGLAVERQAGIVRAPEDTGNHGLAHLPAVDGAVFGVESGSTERLRVGAS